MCRFEALTATVQFLAKQVYLEKEIKNYITEPDQSYKIQFADIEYHLLKLTMKLRRIYQVNTVNLSYIDNYKEMSQIHTASIEEFIFEKLLIDKI